jgi:hypothetical protein
MAIQDELQNQDETHECLSLYFTASTSLTMSADRLLDYQDAGRDGDPPNKAGRG